MQIERYKIRRYRTEIGCGCALGGTMILLVLCAGLYAVGILTPLVLGIMGVQSVGDTNDLFADYTPAPTVILENSVGQSRVTVDLGTYGEESLVNTDGLYSFNMGTTNVGNALLTASFTEDGLLQLCFERSTICGSGDANYRNARIDLRPGGAVVYVEVNTGVFWQRIGIVMRLNSERNHLDVIGVDIDGTTYDPATLPPFLPSDARQAILNALDEVETVVNDLIVQMVLSTGGESYRIIDVNVDDTLLTLIMQ